MKRLSHMILAATFLILLLVGQAEFCMASETRLPPMQKKNKNEVTDFFPKEVKDKVEIEQMMEESRINAAKGVERKEALTLLPDSGQIAGKSSELEGMNQSEAEQKGLQLRAEDNEYWSRAHVNYKDLQVIRHKEDVDDIAKASEKLIARLFDKLKELGVDCKQKKGEREIEPELYIEIEREKQKEVTYDKHLCEYLRNKYNCRDTLSLTCKVKGIQWGEWQDKEIHVPGAELINFGKEIFWIHRTAPKCFEYKLSLHKAPYTKENSNSTPDPYHVLSMREFLAAKHNATIDNISTKMKGSWYGGIFSISGWKIGSRGLGSKDYSWNTYVINYQYREGNPACFDWQETWSEKCTLE